MINEISISGFKSIANATLPLGRVNVFIGSNGSGKSNLLEAVGMLSANASGRVDAESIQRRGIRLSDPLLYLAGFKKSTIKFSIAAFSQLFFSQYTINGSVPDEDEREYMFLSIGSNTFRVGPKDDTAQPKFLDLLSRYRIFAPYTSALRGLEPDRSQADPVGLFGGRLAEAVDELLAFIQQPRPAQNADATEDDDPEDPTEKLDELLELIPWASAMRAVPVGEAVLAREVPAPRTVLEFVDRHMRADANRLTAYDANEGAVHVLFALVVALHPRSPKLAAIDNVDEALNPRLARKLMSLLCAWTKDLAPDRQLLLTCHNPSALDGLPLDDEGVRLFAVDRNGLGHTTVRHLDLAGVREMKAKYEARLEGAIQKLKAAYGEDCAEAKDLDNLKQSGVSLSRLWVMGHLGGVPNV